MAGISAAQFAVGVLRGIGAPVDHANVAAIVGWARAEGGNSNGARFNFLNTTEGMPGAGSINSVGVKSYNSPQEGIRATVQTLKNGHYGNIIQAFHQSNAMGVAQAIGSSPWGTSGSLVSQTIRSALGQNFGIKAQGGGGSVRPLLPGGGHSAFGTTAGPGASRLIQLGTKTTFNQAGYDAALSRAIAGNYVAENSVKANNPYTPLQAKTGLSTTAASNPLISSGALTTTAPNPANYYKTAHIAIQQMAGNGVKVAPHPGVGDPALVGQAINDAKNARAPADAQKLLRMIGNVLGAQYNQGNHNDITEHHGQIRSQGTDCSGFVSWLMGPHGLNIWHTSLATPSIPSAPGMQSGRGQFITIYNNRQAGNAGHVFIQIGNKYFASEGGVGIHQLPLSEVHMYLTQGSDGGTYQAFHPKGM